MTSATRQAAISQATFQLSGADQNPRAVRQKRRTKGFFCSRATSVLDMNSFAFSDLSEFRG
jgi:hypothetical protein